MATAGADSVTSQDNPADTTHLSTEKLSKYQQRIQAQLSVTIAYKNPDLKLKIQRQNGLFDCHYGCISYKDPASLRVSSFRSFNCYNLCPIETRITLQTSSSSSRNYATRRSLSV